MNYLPLIKRMANNLNQQTNVVIPYYNKFKGLVHRYFVNNLIYEISVNDFHKLTGLNKDLSLRLLKELNKVIFSK